MGSTVGAAAVTSMIEDRVAHEACSRPAVAPYCERVRSVVGGERFDHIRRVAKLADEIAVANGFTQPEREQVALAAVLHDAARDLPEEELLAMAPPTCDVEAEHPLALHGRVGRMLAESWGVHDPAVLEAIEGHVFGVPRSHRVGMAVYVADVCEPGRGVNDDIRGLAMRDLEGAYRQAVRSKVTYLQRTGKAIHPRTLRAYEEIDDTP